MATIDVQVAASGDDGTHDRGYSENYIRVGNPGSAQHFFCRFTGITIPAGATIDVAYLQFAPASGPQYVGGPVRIAGDDQDNPGQITNSTDFAGRSRTTAVVDSTWQGYDPDYAADTFANSPSIVSIIEELLASYTISNDAIQFFVLDNGWTQYAGNLTFRSYDYTGNILGPKLHIEYTEAAGTAITAIMNSYRQRRN
jgi:hypothetical protein